MVFKYHYPDLSIMPGSLQIEMMSQALGAILLISPENKGIIPKLVNVEKVVFNRAVISNTILKIVAKLDSYRHGIAKGTVEVYMQESAHICLDKGNTTDGTYVRGAENWKASSASFTLVFPAVNLIFSKIKK